MAKVNRHKAPSRVRYEENHPTVSGRVPKALYEELKEVKEVDGKSFADILKLGLGVDKPQVKKAEQIRERAWDEGYKEGLAAGTTRSRVIYHCSICGQEMEVTSPEARAAVDQCMREKGWGHASCHERKR